MSTHNIRFRGSLRKIITWYPSLAEAVHLAHDGHAQAMKEVDSQALRDGDE